MFMLSQSDETRTPFRLGSQNPADGNLRHSGRDCRNPEHREVNLRVGNCPPWRLDSGTPCRNDDKNLNSTASPTHGGKQGWGRYKSWLSIPLLLFCFLIPLSSGAAQAPNNSVIAQIDLRDVTVGDALRLLSDQSGLNLVASEKAARKRTALFLHNIRPMEVLDAIVRTLNLWYQEDATSHVIRVYTVEEFRLGQVDSIQDDIEIFTLRYPNSIDVAYAIRDLYGYRVQLNMATTNLQDAMMELRMRFQRFDILAGRTQNLGTLQGGSSSSSSSSSSSNSSGGGNMGGNSMGGGNTGGNSMGGGNIGGQQGQTANRPEMQAIQQGLVDQTITGQSLSKNQGLSGMLSGSEKEASEEVSEAIRQQSFIYVTVIRSQNRILVRTRDPEIMKQIRNLVNRLDMGLSTLVLEVKIYSITLNDELDAAVNLYAAAGEFAGSLIPGVSAIPLPVSPSSSASAQGLIATFVNSNFIARLQLLQKQGRLTEIATPLLVTTNQEVSRVFVGSEIPIVTGYTSSASSSGGTGTTVSTIATQPILVPTTELRTIGTSLIITPNINADRTVSLRMLVEQSSVTPDGATIPIPLVPTNGGSATIENASVAVVNAQSYTGTILSKDKLAVAVGGLIQESSNDQISGVPLLMDIPWLGNLFKQTQKIRSRQELIIVMRPHIQATPTEAADVRDRILEQESIHPAINNFDKNMELYAPQRRESNDYRLQENSRLYPYQDSPKGE